MNEIDLFNAINTILCNHFDIDFTCYYLARRINHALFFFADMICRRCNPFSTLFNKASR